MGVEYELKYRADSESLNRVRSLFPERKYCEIPMETCYYDTPDGALSRRHWTLRHRLEWNRHVCTLKTPIAGPGRGEWECECDDIRKALPILAEKASLPELLELTAGGVIPTCGARFTRESLPLYIGEVKDNFKIELALDSGVLINGGRECPFHEIELELKSGDPGKLDLLGEEFAQRFGLVPEPRSKYARARALGKEG